MIFNPYYTLAKKNISQNTEEEEIPFISDKVSWKERLFGRKNQLILGTVMLLATIYLILACTSFIMSGENDLSLILGGDAANQISDAPRYDNWMGKIGATSAFILMYKGFGIGAFFLLYILVLFSSLLIIKATPTPFFKSFRWMIYGLVFSPLIIGFLFHHREESPFPHIVLDINDRWVGAYGIWITQWLTFALGTFGTAVLLITSASISFLIHFGTSLDTWIQRWQERKEAERLAKMDETLSQDPLLEDVGETHIEPRSDLATTISVADSLAKEEIHPEDEIEVISTTPIANTFIEKEEVLETIELEPVAQEPSTVQEDIIDVKQLEDDLGMEVAGPVQEEILSAAELDERLADFGEYDPKLDLSRYEAPSIDLLKNHTTGGIKITKEELEENKNKIIQTLNHYKIEIEKIKATIGPTVTLYEINPAPGVRISKIKSLEDDIALSLAALGIRIIAPIPGKGTIGIEVPNSQPEVVSMRSLIASEKFQNAEMELPVVLGKTISNEIFCVDLAKMPHLLMAGSTGQGKSVGLNAILVSLLYKKHPSQIKFVLVDPKKVELTLFNKIERHFLAKLPDTDDAIITDTSKVVKTLNSLCIEMDQRYELLKGAGCRNIKEYNDKFIKRRLNPNEGHRYLPYIVLVVDEFADLIMTAGREVETPIARLAQLARAIGIHLIIATQRPSVNIITGIIKANFPARIAFRVTSKIDSRTILDAGGADQLIGRGDLLYSTGNDLIRVQCGFVDTPEVEEITEFIGNQQGYPNAFLLPEVPDESGSGEMSTFAASDRDELFEEAARTVVQTQQGSASMLQRKLKLGFNRAGRLVDQLEAAGIIGPFEGSKGRKVLFQDLDSLEQFLQNGRNND